ncbi:MAG: hypothetical protein R2720_13170 [Candidatus Nanopelagicales bacterium]
MSATWWDAAASLFLGSSCVGCQRPGRPWCVQCGAELESAVDPMVLGVDPPVVVSCHYQGCVPDAIVGFKDRGLRGLRPLLGGALAAGVLTALDVGAHASMIVPAASAAAAVRRRGFDHMWDLARVCADSTALTPARLLRSQRRADQAGLSFAARRVNVRGSMRATGKGAGSVIVVDDVRTSGATLAECERALGTAGYTVVAHVVIAASI